MRVSASVRLPEPLSVYFSEISRVPLLTHAQELDLTRRFRETRDPELRRRIVEANLRFVVKIARDWHAQNPRLALEDLVEEGNVGLLKAADKFQPAKNVRFITYAVWWIRSCIGAFAIANWSLVRFGRTSAERTLFSSYRRAREEIERLHPGELEPDVLAKKIARKLRVKPEAVVSARDRLEHPDLSLDAPAGETDATESTFVELLESPDAGPEAAVADAAELVERAARVAHALQSLSPRERAVVVGRYMLEDRKTFNELGAELGFSRERARQIEKRAVGKLRVLLKGAR